MGEKNVETTADWTENPDIEELCDDDLEGVAGGWTDPNGDGGDGG